MLREYYSCYAMYTFSGLGASREDRQRWEVGRVSQSSSDLYNKRLLFLKKVPKMQKEFRTCLLRTHFSRRQNMGFRLSKFRISQSEGEGHRWKSETDVNNVASLRLDNFKEVFSHKSVHDNLFVNQSVFSVLTPLPSVAVERPPPLCQDRSHISFFFLRREQPQHDISCTSNLNPN